MIVATGLILVLVIGGLILYPVARDLYCSERAKARVDTEREAIVDRNEAVQDQIDSIQTPEGIEDRAREQFGWVRDGEEAVNITGLQASDSSTILPDAIAPGSILPYSDWWTQALDAFFGYEYQPPAQLSPDVEPIVGL
jgi:hypothetical protein